MVVAVETAVDPLLVGKELLFLQGHVPGQVWYLDVFVRDQKILVKGKLLVMQQCMQ